MVDFCSWTQDWALIRRYLIVMYMYPFSSSVRVLLTPGLVLGLCLYMLTTDYVQKNPFAVIRMIVPITLFTTLFNTYSFANSLVSDKETGIKSLMLSMGLSRLHYYRAATLCFLMLIFPVALFIGIVTRLYLFEAEFISYTYVIMLFMLFMFHLEALVTGMVSLLSSTNYTSIILLLLILENFLHDFAGILIRQTGPHWGQAILFLVAISPYEPIRLFIETYSHNRVASSYPTDPEPDKVTPMLQPYYLIILSQLFWILIFKLFGYWFEEVCPWQTVSGIRSPCFCFGRRKKIDQVDVDDFTDNPAISAKYFESVNKEQSDIGIKINHVSKVYSGVPAVNDVSFAIYKGETTLLLGHNGAGKSTLMNMILGLAEPDNGSVKILAQPQIQTSIGVCPQSSVLDNNLSVKQHLELFNDIKSSISGQERAAHIRQTIDDVSLTGQDKKRPTELSGGMKRKLSLGIAFVGKSEVLILDEPSSGLDPDSRMFVWNAIRRYRSDRTVLLSTQHMEEADYLGDRIAIMSSGRIVCSGSSVFLNKLFGTGYKLRIECKMSRKKHIMDLIRHSYFDAAQLSESAMDLPRDVKSDPIVDLVIELNKSNNKPGTDPELDLIRLLEDFENNSESHGIRSYGLKSSSIEDVMLNTSKYFAHEAKESTQLVMTSVSGHIAAITDKRVVHEPSSWSLLHALVTKHIQVNTANWFFVVLLRLLLPCWGCYLAITEAQKQIMYGATSNFQSPTLVITFSHMIYYTVRERATKFKTVQLDSKVSVWIYWLSQAITDISGMLVCVVFINMFAAIYLSEAFLVPASQLHGLLTLATILFYLSAMVFCYCLSTVISDHRSSIGYLFLILLMSDAAWFVIYIYRVTVLKGDGAEWLQETFAYLGVILSPTDAFCFFLMGLRADCYLKLKVAIFSCKTYSGPSPVVFGLVALCLQIVAYLVVLAMIESQRLNIEWYCNVRNLFACFKKPTRSSLPGNRETDRDVVEETTKALTAINDRNTDHSLVSARLNKSYVKHSKVIENLAFTVNKGECFGLLGVNGAGKTTTFSMLAAETCPDEGRILANGRYYEEDLRRYREMFGYDPQTTPELSLTPYQALSLMARLRGVNEHSIPMMIGSIMELLEMTAHTHKPDKKLSGGTKRKLALGMALIGSPAILALDEPTAGVDPLARRGVWQLLRSLRARNHASIIISSHAMEECEAICDRISIMARGRLRCIGTFLHLRSKFAKGCTLRVQFPNVMKTTAAAAAAAAASRSGEFSGHNSSSQSSGGQHTPQSGFGDSANAGHHSMANMTSAPSRSQPQPPGHDSRRSSTSSLRATDHLVDELTQQLNSAIGPSIFKLADRNVNSVTFNITDNRVRRSILFRMMRDFRQKHLSVSYMINDSSLEEIFISLAREQQEFEQQQQQHQQQSIGVSPPVVTL